MILLYLAINICLVCTQALHGTDSYKLLPHNLTVRYTVRDGRGEFQAKIGEIHISPNLVANISLAAQAHWVEIHPKFSLIIYDV